MNSRTAHDTGQAIVDHEDAAVSPAPKRRRGRPPKVPICPWDRPGEITAVPTSEATIGAHASYLVDQLIASDSWAMRQCDLGLPSLDPIGATDLAQLRGQVIEYAVTQGVDAAGLFNVAVLMLKEGELGAPVPPKPGRAEWDWADLGRRPLCPQPNRFIGRSTRTPWQAAFPCESWRCEHCAPARAAFVVAELHPRFRDAETVYVADVDRDEMKGDALEATVRRGVARSGKLGALKVERDGGARIYATGHLGMRWPTNAVWCEEGAESLARYLRVPGVVRAWTVGLWHGVSLSPYRHRGTGDNIKIRHCDDAEYEEAWAIVAASTEGVPPKPGQLPQTVDVDVFVAKLNETILRIRRG